MKKICFENNKLTVKVIKELSEFLKANSSINQLNVRFNGIGDKGMINLKKNPSFTLIYPSSNEIGAEGMKIIQIETSNYNFLFFFIFIFFLIFFSKSKIKFPKYSSFIQESFQMGIKFKIFYTYLLVFFESGQLTKK